MVLALVLAASAGPLDTAPKLSIIVANAVETVLTVVAGLAVLMLIVGGIMYIASGGDAHRAHLAKSTIVTSVVGLTVATVSLVLVRVIAGLV